MSTFRFSAWYWWFLVLSGMFLLGLFAFGDVKMELVQPIIALRNFSYFLFQTQFVMQIVFISAVVAHVVEGMFAFVRCVKLRLAVLDVVLWTGQTILLGYPSLKLCLELKMSKTN